MKLGERYPLRWVCRLLGVPRSSVYYRARAPLDDAALKTALLDLGRRVADLRLPPTDLDDEAARLGRQQ